MYKTPRKTKRDSERHAELERLVQGSLQDAADYVDEEISPDRTKATEYYYGQPFGDEADGRSKVVSQDVRDTVHAILPSLMRIFMGAEKPVEFLPQAPGDTAMADQATDYVNHVFQRDNLGYMILLSTIKDALIRRTGVIKTWYDDSIDVSYEVYEGLDDQTVEILEDDDELEVTLDDTYPDEVAIEAMQMQFEEAVQQHQQMLQQVEEAQQQGQEVDPSQLPPEPQLPPEEQWPTLNDVTVKRTRERGQIKVAAVPPEEIIISRGARSFRDCWRDGHVVAHRTELTVSALIAMGYDADTLDDFTSSDELDTNEERLTRDPDSSFGQKEESEEHRKILYTEAWMGVDYDGDGIAELRKLCCLGDQYEVVHQEPASHVPLADFCGDPEPHRAIGRSTADIVMDIQRIKSSILRSSLDSLAQTINPRTGVVEGEVNMDDVLNNEVGGIVRMRKPGMVQELSHTYVGQQAFPMLEYMDQLKERRTGITDATQGLSPDVLQSTTKAAVSATVEAAQQQIELIARTFAETGIRDLFRNILRLVVAHQDKPRTLRLRKDQWVTMDPRSWNSQMDVEVNSALGSGSNEDKMLMLEAITQKQEAILEKLGPANPLVTLGQYSHTLSKMVQLSGFKDSSTFFNELPADYQPPAPPEKNEQSPEMALVEVQREEIQANIEKKKAELELDMQKAQQQATHQRELMLRQDDRERDRNEAQAIINAVKAGVDPQFVLQQMRRDRRPIQGEQFNG